MNQVINWLGVIEPGEVYSPSQSTRWSIQFKENVWYNEYI